MLMGGPRKRPVRRHQRYGKRELSILAMATATVAAFYALSVQNGWAAEKKGTGTIKDVANAEIKLSKANATEDQERQVDQVALHSQEQAIAKLNQLFKKYTGTSKEPVFLSKLADLQQQHATILFRIAHSKSHRSKKTLDLAPYHKMLNQSISSLDRLIAKYPGFEEIPHAYFLRGKAYEELGKKPEAGKNYLHLVHNYPNADESTSAYMSLAEFAIEANDHARAVTFLKEVEKRPEDPHFPFALYKLAWAHYNLKKIPEALSYAERQIKFYNDRKSRDETSSLSNSDLALKENTLLDSAVFYFEGYEEKLPQYSNDMALSYFRNLEEGPILGKMLLRYAKLLRSHSHEADLTSWKNQVLSSASDRPESLDVLILTYEFQLNQHHYDQVVNCAHDMVKLYAKHKEFESFPKAQKQILDTAEGMQAMIVKNKGSSEVQVYSKRLATLYEAFVKIVEEKDPRIPRVHYNLAETLFTIHDYSGATEHYRWVVEHGRWKEDKAVADASLKAIGARYEVLRKSNLIPKELQAQALDEASSKEMDPLLTQWVEWIDTHLSYVESQGKTKASADTSTESFVFESNRAMYAQRQIPKAIERMTRFSTLHPKSQYAIPQATLVLDTYIVSQDWKQTHQLAHSFMEVPEWKKGDFSAKLLAIASDAFYKQLEAKFRARDFKATLKGCDEFLKRYPTSARLADTLSLGGASALEDIDKKRANAYFSRLITEAPKSANVPSALLARASIAEDKYMFGSAAADYKAYVISQTSKKNPESAKQLPALRKKTLILTWLAGDASELKSTLANKAICDEELAEHCDKYAVLTRFSNVSASEQQTTEAFEQARRDSVKGEAKTLWAILALDGAKHLPFRDRNSMIRAASNGWDDLDPLIKFSMLPRLSSSFAASFKLNRAQMKEVAPLKAHEKFITRRVEVIREMENAATKVMKLPWARIKAEVLNEIAGVYLDLSRGLAALSPPKNLSPEELQSYEDTIRKLTQPFEEKGQDMRLKAFEIASRFAIEDSSFAAISEPFFAENPSQAKALKGSGAAKTPDALTPAMLLQLDPKGGWKAILKASAEARMPEDLATENPAAYIKMLWARAIAAGQLQQVAFFMQEAQEKALVQAGVMGGIKGLSLVAAGARGEGFAELEEARRDLSVEGRTLVTSMLLQYYQSSFSKEKVQTLQKELQDLQSDKGEKLADR